MPSREILESAKHIFYLISHFSDVEAVDAINHIAKVLDECGPYSLLKVNRELKDKMCAYNNSVRMALDENCTADEKHCACVPLLRIKLRELMDDNRRMSVIIRSLSPGEREERVIDA